MASVTNYYKLSDLKQCKCICLRYWSQKSEMTLMRLKSSVNRAVCFLEAPGGIHILFSFNFWRLLAFLGSSNLFSSSKPIIPTLLLSYHLLLLPLTLLPLFYKNLCDYIGHIQIIQDNLLISKSLI